MSGANGKLKTDAQVVIVGAGPVGMLAALRLGQAGIRCILIESHQALLKTTRAVVYSPVVLPCLRALGIFDTLKQYALLNPEGNVAWRDLAGNEIARVSLGITKSDEFDGMLIMGQSRLATLVLEEIKKYPSIEVRYGLKLTSITQDPSSSTVKLTANNPKNPSAGETVITANYVLGTDGANSATRHLLDLSFDGFTYDNFRMIGADIEYDFMKHQSFSPLNFTVHPSDWAVIAHTGEDAHGTPSVQSTSTPQWRIAYVESPTLPDDKDSIWSRAEQQMGKYIHSDHAWKLLRAEPYTIQQRSASKAMVGRVALAGDALHSNNPIGGLGLTGGILDAFCYGNAFVRVLVGGEDPSLLEECAQSRLDAWQNQTNDITQGNIERLYADQGEAVTKREEFFKGLNGPNRDAICAKMRKEIDKMLQEDFSAGVEKLVTVK